MLAHDGANAIGPAALWLEIGFDLHARNMCEDENGARYRAAFPPGKRKFGFFWGIRRIRRRRASRMVLH
jgi:hypothetical protein